MFLLLSSHVYSQIRDMTPVERDGVTITECYDMSYHGKNRNGIKVNGQLVIPCKYFYFKFENGYIFTYNAYTNGPTDIYTLKGDLIFPASKKIRGVYKKNDSDLFYDIQNRHYNIEGKYLFSNNNREFGFRTFGGINKELIQDRESLRWYDETGKYYFTGSELDFLVYENDEILYRTCSFHKYGISATKDGNIEEILAPEFEDCAYLGNDLFSFKMNGYWGAMKRDGTIIIPLSRQYSSISYSRTFKKFTFVKRINNVVYKGECNANGVQTVIQKDHVVSTTTTTTKKTEPAPQKKTEPTPQSEKKNEPTPTPQPQPQPRQPQPMQVWVPCACSAQGHAGQCGTCLGSGWLGTGSNPRQCWNCGGSGKCTMCAGQGGHNEIQYR